MFTVWDLIFILLDWADDKLNTNQTWTDIESMMSYAVFNITDKMNELLFRDKREEMVYSSDLKDVIHLMIFDCIVENNQEKEYKSNPNDYLLKQLRLFCINFSKYIEKEVGKHDDYIVKAEDLAKKLCPYLGFDIISFNYSQPFKKANVEFANIHGVSSKKEIVFGISINDEKLTQHIHKNYRRAFTK